MKDWEREVEEEFAAQDEEADALLRHILGDDEPPQGLHRHGYDREEAERQKQETLAQERAIEDYFYPSWWEN